MLAAKGRDECPFAPSLAAGEARTRKLAARSARRALACVTVAGLVDGVELAREVGDGVSQ